MRICYFLPTMGLGGAERRVVLLANAVVRAGHQVSIVMASGPGEFPEPAHPEVETVVLRPGQFLPLGPARLVRWLRRSRPDVFHGFLNLGNYVGCPLARRAAVPVVIGGLGTLLSYHHPMLSGAARWAFAQTDHATANSRGVFDFYHREFGFAADKLTIIPNPIRTADWPCRDAELRAEVRDELGLRPGDQAVVVVGRFMWKKGHTYLVDAAARLDRGLSAQFFLVGGGELRSELESQAARLGLTDRVHFTGNRKDLPRFLQGMDLLCLPSVIEGMPNVVLEGMATGLPTVATTVPGADELVVPGETGWLVPTADPERLAEGLETALQDPDRLLAFGQAARQRAERLFDEPLVAARYLELYRHLLARR